MQIVIFLRRCNGTSCCRNCCPICRADRIIVRELSKVCDHLVGHILDFKFKISLSNYLMFSATETTKWNATRRQTGQTTCKCADDATSAKSKTSNIQIKIQLYLAIYLGCHLTTSDAEGARWVADGRSLCVPKRKRINNAKGSHEANPSPPVICRWVNLAEATPAHGRKWGTSTRTVRQQQRTDTQMQIHWSCNGQMTDTFARTVRPFRAKWHSLSQCARSASLTLITSSQEPPG